MERVEKSQEEHDSLVRAMAEYFKNNGHRNVKASIAGYGQPGQIGDHIPDVTSVDAIGKNVVEAETCDTITSAHTADQWRTFDRCGAKFHVIVPAAGEEAAKRRANELGVTPKIWHV